MNTKKLRLVDATFEQSSTIDIPRLSSFTETRHNDLLRCSICKLKYDPHMLYKTRNHLFICHYCMKVRGINYV